MNYLEEIKSFYVWLETNSLTTPAIVLWHALMHTSNRAGGLDEFAIAYSTLSAKTGLRKDAINRARQSLQNSGRITFRSRAGQQSAIYQLIPFESFKQTQIVSGVLNDSNRAQTEHKPSTNRAQTASIIKDLSSSSSSSAEGDSETFYKAHERVFGFACNPFQARQLGSYIDDDGMDEGVVVRAIERAGQVATGYNFKLIRKILEDYCKSGARTVVQAIALDEAFDNRKQQAAAGGSVSTKQPKKSFSEIAREMDE